MNSRWTYLWTVAIQLSRVSTVLLALTALVVGGATAAQRQAAMTEAAQKSEKSAFEEDVLSASPDPDGGEMAPSGSANAEPAAWILSTTLVKTGDNDPRSKRQQCTIIRQHVPSLGESPCAVLLASSSRVATSLGRQFTLVGAKPSGTS